MDLTPREKRIDAILTKSKHYHAFIKGMKLVPVTPLLLLVILLVAIRHLCKALEDKMLDFYMGSAYDEWVKGPDRIAATRANKIASYFAKRVRARRAA